MKHPPSLESISLSASSLSTEENVMVLGFHPDLFLPLFDLLPPRLFLRVSDESFQLVVKHLSGLWDNNSVVFVDRSSGGKSPAGFISDSDRFTKRSKGLLSNGLGECQIIVCSDSGTSVPVLGSGNMDSLVFDKNVSFDICCDYLEHENYSCVDLVSSPGEFCLRGGLIDVFPFASFYPFRINFLDSIPTVYRFDVDTQLTRYKVNGFNIASVSAGERVALCDVSLDGFLFLHFVSENTLVVGAGSVCVDKINVETITFREFLVQKEGLFKQVKKMKGLSSVAINDRDCVFVPGWFLGKGDPGGSFENVYNRVTMGVPEVSRGDFLVHQNHGVGMCVGLALKAAGNGEQDLLVIKYADGGLVSVDVGRLDLVSFYASSETEGVIMDSLSKSGAWLRKKSAAKKQAEVAVESLLRLYVSRRNYARPPYVSDLSLETDFLSRFPYQDTPDQVSAWNEISKDFDSDVPMDRLLCGDVGFGKTELAIRAAFRVVVSNRRVVVLAPTTILANQLFSSFSSRLEPFAISIDMVSRFRSVRALAKIKNNILSGTNDVLIGTHAILNDEIYLNNIGLLIIDEEHRFGVKQKDVIKGCRAGVDVLSMSATPIPRSINLVLSNIYSISMLQTPPLLRRPIYTRVAFNNDVLIRSVVDFEVGRGGQVYFIHNDIRTIEGVVIRLRSFFSNFSVEYIHGQELSSKIEHKMSLFLLGKIDVLVCTSIIESGIDVPSANCIIINNSHLFGLSQLYQMRGRVGRGGLQAYAYLLIPKNASLSEKAYKRIKTIEENTSLGSGYSVALSDMEIRGSGALFGYKQSGGSGAVGYEMYSQLVRNAMLNTMDGGAGSVGVESIDVQFFGHRYIPEKYIEAEGARMSIYNNLSLSFDKGVLEGLALGLVDRFGPLPRPVKNLIKESGLRSGLAAAGISSVLRRGCGVICCMGVFNKKLPGVAVVEYVSDYWNGVGVRCHVLPGAGSSLSTCIHLADDEDSFSHLSKFINKFTAWKKLIN